MIEWNSFVLGDCMDFLPQFPDKYFDLVLADPPYGIDVANMNMGIGKSPRCPKKENRLWEKSDWYKEKPTDEYFSELFRVSKNQIIFGGNYFNLPPTRCFLIWDKGEGMYGRSFSGCEYAWTSFNEPARIFKKSPIDKSRIHPTQKPLALYDFILSRYAHKGDKILDTHVGSGFSLISCDKNGFDYIGFEKDPYYYKLAKERIEEYKSQMTIFDFGVERI